MKQHNEHQFSLFLWDKQQLGHIRHILIEHHSFSSFFFSFGLSFYELLFQLEPTNIDIQINVQHSIIEFELGSDMKTAEATLYIFIFIYFFTKKTYKYVDLSLLTLILSS